MLKAHPDLRFKPPAEKDVQRAVIALFRHAGFTAYSLSQYRPSHVAVGIPDVLFMHPTRHLLIWWETKPPLARWRDGDDGPWVYYNPYNPDTWLPRDLDKAQLAFRQALLAVNQLHEWGDLLCAESALIRHGFGRRLESGVFQLGPWWAG